MTKVMPNMGEKWIKNPPKTEKCKYCGAEAELGGKVWFEWWQHYIKCSNIWCKNKEIESGTNSVEYIIEKWNEENKEQDNG